MSISKWMEDFNKNLRMSQTVVDNIKYRYQRITKQLNKDFWNSDSETAHSLYVGSYGRGTDIWTSDIDMLMVLPYTVYAQYNSYVGNGQSALIQAVKNSIRGTYSASYVRGDGQVAVINFTDGICFEVVPAFVNNDGSYTYPDANHGGYWKITRPKAEIDAMNELNKITNKNLKRLCRMTRSWKEKWNVPMSGMLIDTLAYNFMNNYEYKSNSYSYYDWMARDFFKYLSEQSTTRSYCLAPGSNQQVTCEGNFQNKAKQCYNLAVEAIDREKDYPYTAKSKWREIYGTRFPE